MKMFNAFGRAVAALGVGVGAVGHWFWTHQHHPFLSRGWEMNGAFELYVGIFLIGIGVHAVASWYWFSDGRPSEPQ